MCAETDVGRERLLGEPMPDRKHLHAPKQAGALMPEELFPFERAHEIEEAGIARCDDRAVFIQQRKRVTNAAARYARRVERGRIRVTSLAVACIERRFRLGKGKPCEQVEKVVPETLAHVHLGFGVNARLVRLVAALADQP